MLVEERDHALLPPRELFCRLRLERQAPCLARRIRLLPSVRHERLLQLGRQARVEEAARVRRPLVLPLPPVREYVGRRLEIAVAHLLRHTRDALDSCIPADGSQGAARGTARQRWGVSLGGRG
eukprot:7202743-Prymnesium_polylepis.1